MIMNGMGGCKTRWKLSVYLGFRYWGIWGLEMLVKGLRFKDLGLGALGCSAVGVDTCKRTGNQR